MCQRVTVDGIDCELQAELMDALGTADLVPDVACGYGDDDIRQGLCLCCVDVAATASRHGYRARRLDTGDWELIKEIACSA